MSLISTQLSTLSFSQETISPGTVDRITGQLKDVINGSGTEDQSSGNLEIIATVFATLANLSHEVNIEVSCVIS